MTTHAQNSVTLNTKPAKTSLLGGHFIYRVDTSQGTLTPSSANIVQTPSDNPSSWGYNTHIGANGIKLRYNQLNLSTWTTDGITLYYPKFDGNLNPAQGDEAATLTTTGLEVKKGGVKGGTAGQNNFIYLSTDEYGSYLTINGANKNDWKLIVGTKFGVDDEGNLYADNANLKGTITALDGLIGGINLDSLYGLYTNSKTSATSSSTGFLISNSGSIYLGAYDSTTGVESCPFQVDENGFLVARSGRIGKFNLTNTSLYTGSGTTRAGMGGDVAFWAGSTTETSAPFRVTYSGMLNATDAIIEGQINATSGTIGSSSTSGNRWQIGSTSIYNGPSTIETNTSGTYIGTDGIRNYYDSTHYVDIKNGKIIAKDAEIHGAIYANYGDIGGWSINSDSIYKGSVGSQSGVKFSSSSFSGTINGGTKDNLMLAIGSKFGVDRDGNLYASGANLTNITFSTDKIESGSYSYAKISSSGLSVFKGTSLSDKVEVANFGETITLGQSGKGYIYITNSGLDIYSGFNDMNIAHFGYGTTYSSSESATYTTPYFTLGQRYITSRKGEYSVAIGLNAIASGSYSLAGGTGNSREDDYPSAIGDGSIAFGGATKAEGRNSQAFGIYTLTEYESQMVIGKANVSGDYAFIVGNGTMSWSGNPHTGIDLSIARSNALTVDWNGNLRLAGKVYINGTGDLSNATELSGGGGGSSSGGETKTGSLQWDYSDSQYPKLYLVGARVQNTQPTTYSDSKVYIGNDRCLYSNGSKVLTSSTLNDGASSSPSFYAPTTAGTSGYYLKSNGSGSAPTWAAISSGGISGSGTSGYLTKWNGSSSITNGPQLGSDTTKFLRNDGSWAMPSVGSSQVAALTYASTIFQTTSHTLTANPTSVGDKETTLNVSKSGYYPVGVVGLSCVTGGTYSRGAFLSSPSSGSCTITLRFNASSTGSKTFYVYVLWVKTS